jgi:acyl transferase domain-containing protein
LQHGLVVDQTLLLLRQIAPQLDEETLGRVRLSLKESLPPFTPEMCPGLVPNNVTGRVANRLDLMGPNYVIDAACAASLISVQLGIEELRRNSCDMMLVGGINASTPAQISMIFNQLGALTRHNIRPFDAEASGTLLGEGLGVLVLKRLADAEGDGDRIYAVLKGVGCASDGKALSSVAPRLEGERLAVQRAYEATGIDPSTVGLVEAHGTSIPLGDTTEIASLASVFGTREGLFPRCALGSVKSMVSHFTTKCCRRPFATVLIRPWVLRKHLFTSIIRPDLGFTGKLSLDGLLSMRLALGASMPTQL